MGHLKNLEAMRAQARAHGLDIVMLMLGSHAAETGEEVRRELAAKGVRIVAVDWDLPPGSWLPVMKDGQIWRRGREGWCGPMDLMRMHIFGLEGYDAVAYFDTDMELQGDVLPALRCAATGVLLTTSGPLAPVSVAIIVVRPDPRILRASVAFAQKAAFSRVDGWAGGGYLPTANKYIGAECGQGLFHTLFYMQNINRLARWALASSGISELRVGQLDRCEWNYQGGEGCGKAGEGFDCGRVRVHHKPKAPTPGCCTKLRERAAA
ncbi:unnamed protein product [Prorocentrum cordatum]|uniref:Nucleotide-diphospho-sugar transferase domain-containing protein n=1 Tax=Prorocentrum cordatum TaxID=2364126 RepID=A0ABN9SFT7_9DINO|nr:unnamed protein product [Polarella glacialis]